MTKLGVIDCVIGRCVIDAVKGMKAMVQYNTAYDSEARKITVMYLLVCHPALQFRCVLSHISVTYTMSRE